jgi:hypothetical protein
MNADCGSSRERVIVPGNRPVFVPTVRASLAALARAAGDRKSSDTGAEEGTVGAGQLVLEAVPGTLLDEHADLDIAAGEALIAEQRDRETAKATRTRPCRCIPGPLPQWDDRLLERTCCPCGRPVARELRSNSGLGQDADRASAGRRTAI